MLENSRASCAGHSGSGRVDSMTAGASGCRVMVAWIFSTAMIPVLTVVEVRKNNSKLLLIAMAIRRHSIEVRGVDWTA